MIDFPTGLIVSAQALDGNPFRNSEALALMAESAAIGGASAIRANGAGDIAAMRKRVSIPIIGIDKRKDSSGRTVITPDFEGAKRIYEAGANIIALDATFYPSDITEDRKELIKRIHEELGIPVMADISTFEEAVNAVEMGVDAVSTTLAGYVPGALHSDDELYVPDFTLLSQIVKAKLPCKVVAEGRIWGSEDIREAFCIGADAVVIGKAITNPIAITRYYNSFIPKKGENNYVPTETRNVRSDKIVDGSTETILRIIQREDATVPVVVKSCIPQVAKLVDAAVESLKNGGRIIYCGAGTSGRLAVADAAECPPTYGIPREKVTAVIAGGAGTIVNASEGCEDSRENGISAFENLNCTKNDLIIGISAAGRAPFVVAFMEKAKEMGCTVGALVNNLDTDMAKLADISVEALTGAEVIKGSTRMKAGSAQKMILNMFSTAVFVKMGCTWQNYMTHMNPSNIKLKKRAIAMVCEILNIKEDEAEKLLVSNNWDIHNTLKKY
ncbi:MAG: N-acetylmuramic acid 6-phosphate etherase [Clostridia bacterium]|nr:N-acetylmuramic acid 6-phosphate etherase [Clostridia bacterium]